MTVYTITSGDRKVCHTATGLAELQRKAKTMLRLSSGFVQMATEDELVNIYKTRGYSVAFSSARSFNTREN